MNTESYKQAIKRITIPIDTIVDDRISMLKWLSDEIYAGKAELKSNSVEFIIAKVLSREKKANDLHRRSSFDVYVIGSFRKTFIPVLRVAEAFASFYLEMGTLPKIIPIPKYLIEQNKEILAKLKNGVLLYERR